MAPADPREEEREKRKRTEEEPPGAKKKKRKPHLGRKEREKLRKAAAAAQSAADEEAGRVAAGGAAGVADAANAAGEAMDADGKAKHRSRYTVFVGNLPYDATTQDVFKHFDTSLRGMVLDVRMNHDKGTGEFRGTCFVDFKDAVTGCSGKRRTQRQRKPAALARRNGARWLRTVGAGGQAQEAGGKELEAGAETPPVGEHTRPRARARKGGGAQVAVKVNDGRRGPSRSVHTCRITHVNKGSLQARQVV